MSFSDKTSTSSDFTDHNAGSSSDFTDRDYGTGVVTINYNSEITYTSGVTYNGASVGSSADLAGTSADFTDRTS